MSCQYLHFSDEENGWRSWHLQLSLCTFRVNWVSLDCLAILEDKDLRLEKHTNSTHWFPKVTLVTDLKVMICLPGFSGIPRIPWFQRREGNSGELVKHFASFSPLWGHCGGRAAGRLGRSEWRNGEDLRRRCLHCVCSVSLMSLFFTGSLWKIRTKGTKRTDGEFRVFLPASGWNCPPSSFSGDSDHWVKRVQQILSCLCGCFDLILTLQPNGCYLFPVSSTALQPSAQTLWLFPTPLKTVLILMVILVNQHWVYWL